MRQALDRVIIAVVAASLGAGFIAPVSHAQTALVDTGQGNASGGHTLFNSPPSFNFLACRFTQGSAFDIGTIQAWMVRPSGTIMVKLCTNSPGNLPGTVLASSSFPVSFAGFSAQWTSFVVSGGGWSQPAGTYWISFEPASGTTGGSMPGGVPAPLPATAYFTNGNPGYVLNGSGDVNGRYGLRLYTPAPPPAIHVPANQPTVQAAIDASSLPGQEIIVAPGTYSEAINFNGKTISLRSSGGAASTTINAAGTNLPAVQIPAGSAAGTRLEGFTVSGGAALTGLAEGGGILIQGSTVSIVSCTVADNDADSGGGAAVRDSANATFQNCTFSSNGATTLGGGVYINGGSASFTGCEFTDNTAGNSGGGLNINSNAQATLSNCTFDSNSSPNAGGGAMVIGSTASGSFTNCSFITNTAAQAGGAGVNGSTASFLSCLFDDNTASFAGATSGGGLQAQGAGSLTLTLCEFYSNQAHNGAGAQLLAYTGTASIAGCGFDLNVATNAGGGLHCSSSTSVTLSNCWFYDNIAVSGGGTFVGASILGVAHSVFCNNAPNGIVGAYTDNGGNFLSCPQPGDTDGDGVINVNDLLSVINAWGRCPALPAACPADLDDDGAVDVDDLLLVINNWD